MKKGFRRFGNERQAGNNAVGTKLLARSLNPGLDRTGLNEEDRSVFLADSIHIQILKIAHKETEDMIPVIYN